MGASFEWYASNTRIAYPFKDEFVDPVGELFVDAYILHNLFVDDPREIQLTLFNPPQITFTFTDGDPFLSLNSPQANVSYYSTVFGQYTLYEWRKVSTVADGFTGEEAIVKIVVKTEKLATYVPPITPTSAVLNPSLVNPRVRRVRKIALKQPGLPLPIGGGWAEGYVKLEAGLNMNIQKSPSAQSIGLEGILPEPTTRVPTTIIVEAIPGAGEGAYSDCTEGAGDIKKINDVGPDSVGNFVLAGDSCVWVERPVVSIVGPTRPNTNYKAVPVPATLSLHDDCKACCDCSDFGSAYQMLSDLWDRAKAVSLRVEAARKKYEELRLLMQAAVAQKCVSGFSMNLFVLARPDYHVAAGATFVNNTAQTVPLTTVQFCFNPGGFEYETGSGIMNLDVSKGVKVTPVITGTCVQVSLPAIKPGKFMSFSFEVRYGSGSSRADGSVVRVVSTATNALGIFQEVKSTSLLPPLKKD